MAKAAKLFYSTDATKQTLYRRIIPTDEQKKIQQERWNDLMEYIREDLKIKTGYFVSSWLQGSYKFETQIRPASPSEEFDIDLGVYFEWEGSSDAGKFNPVQLKTFVQNSLESYLSEPNNESIEVVDPPKNRCNRIRFKDNFHIDTPVYHLDSKKDTRFLATQEDKWEASDPKALFEWFKSECKDEEEGKKIRRLIRYIKIWAALSFDEIKRPSTIMLTVLMVEAFKKIKKESLIDDDDDLFALSLKAIEIRLESNKTVLNPVDLGEDLNRMKIDDFSSFFVAFKKLILISEKALIAKTEAESAFIWQDVFKYFFPIPEVFQEIQGTKQMALSVVEFIPRISINGESKQEPKKYYNGIDAIGPIPKKCTLRFNLLNADKLPYGATVEWMIRNEGDEAENKNDLGHYSGTKLVTEESTAYNGTHHVDVVVKSFNGIPIGFLRVPVIVYGEAIPPRNPKQKPSYTRINN